MTDDAEKPLTLRREDLYELVWSKPMLELAKDFGISDVALAKRCRGLGIPVPGRGYWARVEAGQTPHRPVLPKRESQWHDARALTVAPPEGACRAPASVTSGEEGAGGAEATEVLARIARYTVIATASLAGCLPAVKRAAMRARHPEQSQLTFERGQRVGPCVAVETTGPALDRALRLADTLLRACEALGWRFDDPKALKPTLDGHADTAPTGAASPGASTSEPRIGQLLVEGELVDFKIEERFRDEPCTPTAAQLQREKGEYRYRAPRTQRLATGALRVIQLDPYPTYRSPGRRTWYDHRGKLVETQIADILRGFYQLALSIRARRAKAEAAARTREEQARRQAEAEARREAHQKLIAQLERDAGAWHRARYLRRYLHAAQRALGSQRLPAAFQEARGDFLTWAQQYLDQLDPLTPEARTGEFAADAPVYYRSDLDRLKDSFARLCGADWARSFKAGTDYPPKPAQDEYGRPECVFEVAPSTISESQS